MIVADVTMYTPCSSGSVMANGQRTSWGSAAVNGLPLGTRIKFKHRIFGRKVFHVRDRGGMPNRYDVDLWTADCTAALRWGRHRLSYRIVGRDR